MLLAVRLRGGGNKCRDLQALRFRDRGIKGGGGSLLRRDEDPYRAEAEFHDWAGTMIQDPSSGRLLDRLSLRSGREQENGRDCDRDQTHGENLPIHILTITTYQSDSAVSEA